MMMEDSFISVVALIGEKARAKMLWNLLDGRAYTASELALVADVSGTSASNHLTKLLEAQLLKVETQGRHRYYSFASHEIAYVVESLANLTKEDKKLKHSLPSTSPIRYCRTCYDHLAGNVGVRVTEALQAKKIIIHSGIGYNISDRGWKWFYDLGIYKDGIVGTRRPVTRQCLDWSERRPHLAGQLGAAFFNKALEKKWFKRKQFSRELIITSIGKRSIHDLLNIDI